MCRLRSKFYSRTLERGLEKKGGKREKANMKKMKNEKKIDKLFPPHFNPLERVKRKKGKQKKKENEV